MELYPLLRTSFVCWTQAPLSEVCERLQGGVDRGVFRGSVGQGQFSLTHTSSTRNSWRPHARGSLSAHAGGTLAEVTLAVHPFVAAFTLLHGMLLFGISWLMGIAAFSWEVGTARDLIVDTIGATAVGEQALDALPTSDPAEPGSESRAPYRLGARASGEGVLFRVPGRSRFGLEPPRTAVEIDARGLSVAGKQHDWEAFRRCNIDSEGSSRVLILLDASGAELDRLPCEGLSERDALWLACYLEAQAKRFTLPPEERLRQDNERAKLAGLVQAARPEEPV